MKSLLFSLGLLIAGLYAYSWHFIITVLAISFLIFFHELGHFLAARLLGVGVNAFSIGFGEALYSFKKGQTEYKISAIPLGGYVQLKGQDDSDPSISSNDPDSYNTLSPFGRILILVAGPAFNFLLAFFIYIAIGFLGEQRLGTVVANVAPDSAASIAGIKSGDKILSINGKIVSQWSDISPLVNTDKSEVRLKRGDEELTLIAYPKMGDGVNLFGEKISKPLLGISPSNETVIIYHRSDALKYAAEQTWQASGLIFAGIGKLLSGVVPVSEVGGIMQITDVTSKAAKTSLQMLLLIVALISVNLGVLNLLPIPALDGGHILFNLYELISRRAVPKRAFEYLTYAGWAVLGTLMIVATFNDIMRLGQ
ncbi:RIP metalloprotease RseP [Campylobacter sp. 19-13652]|uniref:RIP metalloprotease RseP n=1 Tax=Campylobacter sp. 19-13652 TaxID=2840180 RepID=UPI001C7416C8|nr:RIP metalloprotease RseP [Campylobacter sp. 19-13652]BCX79461.1 putative zinc metalloprotease [Campylobacter sp. 19-13652]